MTDGMPDIRQRMLERLRERGIPVTRFAKIVGMDDRTIAKIMGPERYSLKSFRLRSLKIVLDELGFTFDDYDPRIVQAFRAAPRIQRAISEETSIQAIIDYTGISSHSELHGLLNALIDRRLESITYSMAIRLAKADNDEFELFAANNRRKKKAAAGSLVVLDDCGNALSFGSGALDIARRLGDKKAGKALLTRIGGYMMTPGLVKGAEYDENADKLTFGTETGLYRFEVTKRELVAIWAKTGEVSMRRAI